MLEESGPRKRGKDGCCQGNRIGHGKKEEPRKAERLRRKKQPDLKDGESHGQKSMVGYSPWVRKELDTAEQLTQGFPGGSVGKESTCNVGDLDSIPGLGRSPGGGHSNPL